MLFNSYEFIFYFLPITVFGYYILGHYGLKRMTVAWLVVASLYFYAWWNPAYVFLLLVSIVLNYLLAKLLSRKEESRKTLLLTVGVAGNLAILGYFKYTNFFLSSLGAVVGADLPIFSIILPLGISFFTFQQIAFLVDTRRGVSVEGDFLHYCLFVTFFPQLIAGPIVHHKEMMPQFGKSWIGKLNYENLAVGITIFGIGLFKKVILADTVALYATVVFKAAGQGEIITFLTAWQGALAYTVQIYFDFSGYSEMAIGLGRMFGIKLPANFDTPYGSMNIVEFWRRWHITLSRFLRDYLYFTLGGNRKGAFRRYVNVMIVMLLGGLWHGAGWTFIVWGGIHGVCILANHLWRRLRKWTGCDDPVKGGTIFARCVTLVVIVTAWVFFRAEDLPSALNIVSGMAGLNGILIPGDWSHIAWAREIIEIMGGEFGDTSFFSWKGTSLSILLLLLAMVGPNTLEITRKYKPTTTPIDERKHIGTKWLIWEPNVLCAYISSIIILAAVLSLWKTSEFLYFQF